MRDPFGGLFYCYAVVSCCRSMRKGTRVSWRYQDVTTYGTVVSGAGTRASIKGPSGGTITRVGTKDDPLVKIKSESTGNIVLKRRSQIKIVGAKK